MECPEMVHGEAPGGLGSGCTGGRGLEAVGMVPLRGLLRMGARMERPLFGGTALEFPLPPFFSWKQA